MRQLSPRVWLFAIAFAILFGAVWILAAQFPAAWELSDFNVTFYRVGRYLLRGENVYLSAYPHPYNGREYPPFAPLFLPAKPVPAAPAPAALPLETWACAGIAWDCGP